MKDIGDRMKNNYENRSRFYLTRRTPVIIRLDGRAFHTFTKAFKRPFDDRIESSMAQAMKELCLEVQGAKLAYTQSDEISILLTDWDGLQTEAWFDYNLQKICSVSASIVTTAFNSQMSQYRFKGNIPSGLPDARFDARVFNIPREEVTNYFLWRGKDWYRNSVTMYAQAHFSHKQLEGVNMAGMHEMLHGIGKNWATDLTPAQKNGTFYCRYKDKRPSWWGWKLRSDVTPNYPDVDKVLQEVLPC